MQIYIHTNVPLCIANLPTLELMLLHAGVHVAWVLLYIQPLHQTHDLLPLIAVVHAVMMQPSTEFTLMNYWIN